MAAYKATPGTVPSYPSQLVRVPYLPGQHSLQSAWTNHLLVPSVKLYTVGSRAFPVPSHQTHNLEQSDGQCYNLANLPSASENISVPGLVP